MAKAAQREYGMAELSIDDERDIFAGIPVKTIVWMSHGDRIERCPSRFKPIAHTANSPIAAVADRAVPS